MLSKPEFPHQTGGLRVRLAPLVGFHPYVHAVPLPDGRIVVADSTDYRLRVIAADGTVVETSILIDTGSSLCFAPSFLRASSRFISTNNSGNVWLPNFAVREDFDARETLLKDYNLRDMYI